MVRKSNIKKKQLRQFDEYLIESLKDQKEIIAYLSVALDEYSKDNDSEAFALVLKDVMRALMDTKIEYKTRYAIYPGVILKEVLREKKMTQNELSIITGIARDTITLIIKGSRRVTANNAARLEEALGIRAEYWLNLQQILDLFYIRRDVDVSNVKKKAKKVFLANGE